MLFERFEAEGLAHYSYLIGDGTEAAVLDPRRDARVYVETAHRAGMRIKYGSRHIGTRTMSLDRVIWRTPAGPPSYIRERTILPTDMGSRFTTARNCPSGSSGWRRCTPLGTRWVT